MNTLKQIYFCYWNVTRLKESPENTPYSLALFVMSILLFTLIMLIQWSFSRSNSSHDLLLVFSMGLSLVFSFIIYTGVILYFKGFGSRFVQTITSLLYAHSIVHLLAFPLFIIDPHLNHSNLKNPIFLIIGVFYLFITLALSVWQFVITAHIYKYALNTTPLQSVFAAFGLIAVNILTLSFWR